MKYIKYILILRRICVFILAILLFLLLVNHFFTDMSRIKFIEANGQGDMVPEAPPVSAASAVLMEASSGRVIFEVNKDEKHYPASTTKIMTALLAVEFVKDQEIPDTNISESEEKLKSKVKVSQNAAYQEGSSIFLKPDEEISFEDLLYGMMLRSGNDAAVAVAEAVGGTVDDFVIMMNERAMSIGMNNSHFMNPNGLQNEEHYSTAYDLALLGREGMKNELFRTIVSAKVWNGSRQGIDNYNYFYNKNKVIFQYEGGTGIKIGYTQAAGRCLVASAERNNMELIAVVLNDPNWFEDVYKMFDYGFSCYNNVLVAEGERVLTHIPVRNGDSSRVAVGAYDDIICPCKKGEKTRISIEYVLEESVEAPVRRWQEAGSAEIYSSGEFVCSCPLYYMEDVDREKGTTD